MLDSDSGDKAIDDVNGYRWAEWSRSPEACDDQQELDLHGLFHHYLAASRGIDFGDLTEQIVADHGARIERAHATAEELNSRLGLALTSSTARDRNGWDWAAFPFSSHSSAGPAISSPRCWRFWSAGSKVP